MFSNLTDSEVNGTLAEVVADTNISTDRTSQMLETLDEYFYQIPEENDVSPIIGLGQNVVKSVDDASDYKKLKISTARDPSLINGSFENFNDDLGNCVVAMENSDTNRFFTTGDGKNSLSYTYVFYIEDIFIVNIGNGTAVDSGGTEANGHDSIDAGEIPTESRECIDNDILF